MKEIDFRHDLLPLKDKLFRLALRITLDRPEAEDVVEDVLVKTWEMRNSPEMQEIKNLESYCLTMTRNLALDRAAKKEAQNVSLDELTDAGQGGTEDEGRPKIVPFQIADTSVLPDQRLEYEEKYQWVHDLFLQLPEKQRSVMQLRDIEEHSYQEVAEILQITESDVKVTLFRARQALKQLILSTKRNGL